MLWHLWFISYRVAGGTFIYPFRQTRIFLQITIYIILIHFFLSPSNTNLLLNLMHYTPCHQLQYVGISDMLQFLPALLYQIVLKYLPSPAIICEFFTRFCEFFMRFCEFITHHRRIYLDALDFPTRSISFSFLILSVTFLACCFV